MKRQLWIPGLFGIIGWCAVLYSVQSEHTTHPTNRVAAVNEEDLYCDCECDIFETPEERMWCCGNCNSTASPTAVYDCYLKALAHEACESTSN